MSTAKNKLAFQQFCNSQAGASYADVANGVESFFTTDAKLFMVHPFNELNGISEYTEAFLQPLYDSFDQLRKTQYILIGGNFDDGEWIASTGYYSGNFRKPWLGIRPTGALNYLRFAEFHRMQGGKAVESYLFLDIPALMMSAGVWPIKYSVALHAGYNGYIPGPSTQDGLVWHKTDQQHSKATLKLTEDMLLDLATEDEAWRAYWHDDMTWYGSAVFGAFQGKEEFAGFQTPFENTFSEWVSGIKPGSVTKHFLRMADGDYSCLGGWPSLNMMQVKPFLGHGPTDKRVYMRVCDFWRREGDLLAENWVIVDALHFLLQLDCDVLGDLT